MSEKVSLFRNLIKSYGSGMIDVIRENTVSQAAERLRTAEIPVRDLNAILESLWYHTEYTHSYSVEEHTGRLLKLRVTRCLFAEEMRKHKAEEIGDAFYCAYDYGFCHGLNPDISFSRSKTLMKGHDCCDHSYTLIIK